RLGTAREEDIKPRSSAGVEKERQEIQAVRKGILKRKYLVTSILCWSFHRTNNTKELDLLRQSLKHKSRTFNCLPLAITPKLRLISTERTMSFLSPTSRMQAAPTVHQRHQRCIPSTRLSSV